MDDSDPLVYEIDVRDLPVALPVLTRRLARRVAEVGSGRIRISVEVEEIASVGPS